MSEENNIQDDSRMPLTQHLEELRHRLLICFLSIGFAFVICYMFSKKIYAILAQPWIEAMPEGVKATFFYSAPHEAFFTYMKVSFIAATILSVPILLWQIWLFIAPGLYQNEKRYMVPVVFFSGLCFLTGAFFGYFIVFPKAFQFFASFQDPGINFIAMMKSDEYLSFANRMLLCFGLAFELPVFLFFLGKLGIIDSDFLKRKRKVAIVLIFIIAAVITPSADVFSQLLMAGPLMVLYEISVWIVHFFGSKPFKTGESEDSTSAG